MALFVNSSLHGINPQLAVLVGLLTTDIGRKGSAMAGFFFFFFTVVGVIDNVDAPCDELPELFFAVLLLLLLLLLLLAVLTGNVVELVGKFPKFSPPACAVAKELLAVRLGSPGATGPTKFGSAIAFDNKPK